MDAGYKVLISTDMISNLRIINFEFWIPPRILQTAKFTTLCEKYNELYSTPQQQRTHRRKGALKRVGERSWGPTLAATSCLWQPLCSGADGRSVRAAAGSGPARPPG